MSQLVVRRQSRWRQDRLRSYRVMVDGVQAGSVRDGEEAILCVAPGSHRVWLQIDWCRSPPIDVEIESGATRVLACGSSVTPLLGLLYASVFRHRYLWLRREPDHAAQAGEA